MRWLILVLAVVFVSGCIGSSETQNKTCEQAIAELPAIIAEAQNSPAAEVTEIIDGDTIELSDASRVRLIGINSPERNEHHYIEAKENLEFLILDRQVYLQKDITDRDKYDRYLRYIFTEDKFVNAEQISAGFATSYEYPPDTKHQFLFNCLEKEAKSAGLGIWKRSLLYNFAAEIFQNPDDVSDPSYEYIVLTNLGNKVNLNGWKLKDEATHIYTFGDIDLETGKSITINSGKGTDTDDIKYWNLATTIWNNDGDTVFLRDAEGNLAHIFEY